MYREPKFGKDGVVSEYRTPNSIFRHDVRDRIIFNTPPVAPGRLHPVRFMEETSTIRNRAKRWGSDIEKVLIGFKKCRMSMVLEDSKRGLVQKNHVVIGRKGEVWHFMDPTYWIRNKKDYNIFLDWRYDEPIPVLQMEALKFVLNSFEAVMGPRTVYLESTWKWGKKTIKPGTEFTDALLERIFPQDWSNVKGVRIER